jgi:hypothetical protein
MDSRKHKLCKGKHNWTIKLQLIPIKALLDSQEREERSILKRQLLPFLRKKISKREREFRRLREYN